MYDPERFTVVGDTVTTWGELMSLAPGRGLSLEEGTLELSLKFQLGRSLAKTMGG